MEMRVSTRSCPGFRFSPAEEELVLHYLRRKIEGSKKCDVISEIDAVRHEPWDLPGLFTSIIYVFCVFLIYLMKGHISK